MKSYKVHLRKYCTLYSFKVAVLYFSIPMLWCFIFDAQHFRKKHIKIHIHSYNYSYFAIKSNFIVKS